MAIEVGVKGILRVMNCLEMYRDESVSFEVESLESNTSKWIRATCGGIFHLEVNLGDKVARKQELGFITNAFGEKRVAVRATVNGMVISHIQNPLVNQGDAIIHLAIV